MERSAHRTDSMNAMTGSTGSLLNRAASDRAMYLSSLSIHDGDGNVSAATVAAAAAIPPPPLLPPPEGEGLTEAKVLEASGVHISTTTTAATQSHQQPKLFAARNDRFNSIVVNIDESEDRWRSNRDRGLESLNENRAAGLLSGEVNVSNRSRRQLFGLGMVGCQLDSTKVLVGDVSYQHE